MSGERLSALAKFLKDLPSPCTHMTLVGPLYGRMFQPTTPTIFVDGGSDFHCAASGTTSPPTVSVGDGDSSAKPLDEKLPPAKDFSDLAFALRQLPASVVELRLLGFLGGRRDHELANFGEVARFLDQRVSARADFGDPKAEQVWAFRGSLTLQLIGVFSTFVLEPCGVHIKGACDYPLSQDIEIAPLSSHGLSNRGFGQVEFRCAKPCFVFLNPA